MANPMKKVLTILAAFCIAALLFAGCNDEFDSLVDANADRHPIPDTEIEAASGDADFSNYVAIGNSLTAGYMDGALYDNGQRFSVAAILAAQLEAAGGATTFVQPDINSENGFNTLANSGGSNVLGRFKLDTSIPGPSPTVNGDEISVYDGPVSELNNFGVPGIKVGQLLTADTGVSGTDSFNPFYERFASSPGSSTVLDDIISADPSFFTLWIGNNDVLGFAASGGTNDDELTSLEDFEIHFEETITTLMNESTSRGVVATIPPILTIPFFRAVPYNPITVNEQQATQLNEAYSEYNDGLEQALDLGGIDQNEKDRRMINFTAGSNGFVMVDNDLTDFTSFGLPNWRLSEPTDLILLNAAQAFQTGVGTQSAAPANLVLTQQDQDEIQDRVNQFNEIIDSVTSKYSNRIALFEVNSGLTGDPNEKIGVFADLLGFDGEEGIRVNGTLLAPDFSPNGVFSTDGVHPNARGNALLVNEMIDIIEAEFDAVLPRADVLSYPTVTLCGGDCVSQQGGS